MCGAGKSTAANYLKGKSFAGLHFGSLTLEEIKRLKTSTERRERKNYPGTIEKKKRHGRFC